MEIKRDIYLNRLISRKNNGLIKIVTGIRRSGKSYLLDPIFKNYLQHSGHDYITALDKGLCYSLAGLIFVYRMHLESGAWRNYNDTQNLSACSGG